MKIIDTLSSAEGRLLLHEIFRELRYEKQLSGIRAMAALWKVSTSEREVSRYVKKDINILHPLGFFRGTGLWLEEVVNRFFFSTINSFVYFGAAILLVLIGLRRFSGSISDSTVIAGVIFEALLLLFMFIVMLFTPSEEAVIDKNSKENGKKSSEDELLLEIGELGRDFASAVINLENLNIKISDLTKNQESLIIKMEKIAESFSQAVSPNPKMLEAMNKTNQSLEQFGETVRNLNETAKVLRSEEIELAVRKELEKLISGRISERNEL